MTLSSSQNELRNGDIVVAVFMPYKGQNRCAKCCFSDKKCKEALCTPDERKDKRQGFWRAANKNAYNYSVAEGFKMQI